MRSIRSMNVKNAGFSGKDFLPSLSIASASSFSIAAFMWNTVLGFVVVGVLLFLLELRFDDREA